MLIDLPAVNVHDQLAVDLKRSLSTIAPRCVVDVDDPNRG
jgi:hypothetical protein